MISPQQKRPMVRCAIYTRKSTDEGLEMEYNSLEAQRDAAEAYIRSQMHEGWMLVQDILFRGSAGWQRLGAGTAGQFLKTQGTGANPVWGYATPQTLIVQDEKSSGTMGGSFTSGAWRTRDLNTTVLNEISGASLGSNQITLPAGTYEIFASAPSTFTQAHQAKFYNVTDGTDTVMGMMTSSSNASGSPVSTGTNAEVVGKFTIAGTKTFEIQHRCEATRTSDGFGRGGNWGNSIFTFVQIKKVG